MRVCRPDQPVDLAFRAHMCAFDHRREHVALCHPVEVRCFPTARGDLSVLHHHVAAVHFQLYSGRRAGVRDDPVPDLAFVPDVTFPVHMN